MNHASDFDYKKYLQLIVKKRYLFVTLALAIMATVTVTSYLLPERFEARSTVFIEKSVISELVRGIAITPSFEDKVRVLAYAIRSRALLLKVFDDLDMNVNKQNSAQLEKLVREVQARTDIKLKDREGLFIISYTDKDPRIARDFVNTLVRRYIEENITSKREESYGATKFLAEQIADIKAKLEESEAKLNSYRRQNSGLLGQSEAMTAAEINDGQQRLDEISVKRRQLEQMQQQALRHDPLDAKLAQLQKKQQELSLTYTDQHPEIVEVRNEMAAIREQQRSGAAPALRAAVTSPEADKIGIELNSLREAENNQRRFIASRQYLLRSVPAARAGLEELERERNSQRNLYEQLVARYGQSEVSKQMEVQDKTTTFRVVDPAILPTKPVSPQRVKIILFGIVGGLLASFAFLVLLDHHDKSVRTVRSLKSLGIRILAVVPSIPDPAAIAAIRRRDKWFYAVAGACFLVIVATVPIELIRYLSVDIFSPSVIRQRLVQLTGDTFK
ncbi:XrtA system polysaccharide chain length determinant [Trichlorobacter ammonificans]|uniref:Chain-length determining protein n=1 Tax=Trichlorobacter ammonificans TaxID=2916410 RepID=A0ABN8HJJ3_9BACT|nr:XrtA system polysaccharide chain length determinant [Trichlorobacter ammonificans]CAH2031362.1 Chain-length determining protein [Trichlorobacter ammonificans]